LMPMFCRFGLLMESLSFCVFLFQLLTLLSKRSSVFSLIFIFSSSPEILSSTCSSLLQWLFLDFLFDLWNFLFPGFCLILFSEVFHIFVKFLFHILCCLLYIIDLFFIVSFVSFWSLVKSFLSIYSFLCLPKFFICGHLHIS
jgi:hypothetical protein